MKYLWVIIACVFLACATGTFDGNVNDICLSETDINDINCYTTTSIKVYIDNSFPQNKQLLLASAFAEWSIKTNARVHFDLMFVPVYVLTEHPGLNNTYYVFNRNPADQELSGHCTWAEGNSGTALIELRPDLNRTAFMPVALHEIGHALHLKHYNGMYTSLMDGTFRNGTDISCYDIKAFCNEWNCNIACELEKL